MMNVESICTREVVLVDASQTLQQAASLMRAHPVGALLVIGQTEQGPQAVGVITDRDLVIEAMAQGLDRGSVEVGHLASGRIAAVPGTASLDDAIAAMQKEGVRRLLVTTAEGRLAGIVSLDDVLEALAAQMVGLARAVRGGLAREASQRGPLLTPDLGAVRVPAATAAVSRPMPGGF
jgi:CBS domain-containing protein